MATDVEAIRPESSLMDAAKTMKFRHVDSLLVCDGRRLLGTITNRDIAIHSSAGHDPNDTLVSDCMDREIVYCFEDQEINEAERIMQEKQLRRLPVLTREKKLVGILMWGDFVTKTGEACGPTAKPLENSANPRMQSFPTADRTENDRAEHKRKAR